MYSILIADDEATEREVIRFLLKKDSFPFRVSEASNGKIAWDMLEKAKFDILFTDIRMPFFDGIELASKARCLYPDMQIIFFSGYDDFAYVKEALSLHVVNYILKPVNPEEFKTTITQVLHSLEEQKALSQKEKTAEKFTRNHILYQLINGANLKQSISFYTPIDFSFLYEYHHLLLLQFERDFWGKEETNESSIIQQLLPQDCDFVNLNPAQSLILFYGQKHHPEWYRELADNLSRRLWQKYHINSFTEISAPFQTPEEIPSAYEKAELLLADRLFFTGNTLESRQSFEAFPENGINDDMIYHQIQTDIQLKDAEGLIRHMSALLETYKNAKNYSHIYVRFLCTNLLKVLCDGLAGHTEDSFDEYARSIYNLNHFSEIEALLMRLSKRLADILEQEQTSPRHAIQLVKQYICQHYSEELSLDILSAEIHLTPRYLSALFIKEMGCGINKYIKKVRMKKAKELLLQTNLKINEIARRVGYSNLSYFCKSFVDDFEITPEKFRADPTTAKNQESLHDFSI